MTVIVVGHDDDETVRDEAQKSSELEDEADAVVQSAFAPVAVPPVQGVSTRLSS